MISPIQTEKVLLPSKGFLYDNKLPDGYIEVRPFTIKEEMLLTDPRLLKTQNVLSLLLKEVIITPNISSEELLTFDRIFLFLYLRTISYGKMYPIKINCPYCLSSLNVEIDLSQLPIRYAEKKEDLQEPFKIELPHLETNVYLRYSRGKDELPTDFQAQFGRGNPEEDEMRLFMRKENIEFLTRITTKIDNVEEKDWKDFYYYLTPRDFDYIFFSYLKREYGIKTLVEITCSECGGKFKKILPFHTTFFRSADSIT